MKRKARGFGLRFDNKKRYYACLLENVACIQEVTSFLSLQDACALHHCSKKLQLRCFKEIHKRRRWNVRELTNANCLDLVTKIMFKVRKEDTEIPHLALLKNVNSIKIKCYASVCGLTNQNTMPDTIMEWKCRGSCVYSNLKTFPLNLKLLRVWHFLGGFSEKFPLMQLQPGVFPNSLTSLAFNCNRSLTVDLLPPNLLNLNVACKMTILHAGIIPQTVQNMFFSTSEVCEIQKESLPHNLLFLILKARKHSQFAHNFHLPHKLQSLCIKQGFLEGCTGNLPSSLSTLEYCGSHLFFSRLTCPALPQHLTSLTCRNVHSFVTPFLPIPFLPIHFGSQLAYVNNFSLCNMRNIDIVLFAHLSSQCLKHLSLISLNIPISLAALKALETIDIDLRQGAHITDLEMLPALHTVIIDGYVSPIQFPVCLQNLDISTQKTHIQNLSSLTNLTQLALSHRGHYCCMTGTQFPQSLRTLEIDALSIRSRYFWFPRGLLKLTVNCLFQKHKLLFPDTLLSLTLSKSCVESYTSIEIPPNLQVLWLPRKMIGCTPNIPFTHIKYR